MEIDFEIHPVKRSKLEPVVDPDFTLTTRRRPTSELEFDLHPIRRVVVDFSINPKPILDFDIKA